MTGVWKCLALSLVFAELAGARREKLAASFSPYGPASPLSGWSYYLESERKEIWPSCKFRFLSSSKDCSTVNLWQGAGKDQNFHLEEVPNSSSTFYLKAACGNYLSYSSTCSEDKVDTRKEAGANQQFRIKALGSFKWSLEAVGRASCYATKFLSFPSDCENHAVHLDSESSWLLHPATGDPNQRHFTNTGACADPFIWQTSEGKLHMTCTGGDLAFYEASAIAPDVTFKRIGSMLGGEMPTWASKGARWAPENLEVDKNLNALVFSDQQDDGKQRVGWVLSFNGTPGSWSTYSSGHLDLGNRPGGEIDPHIFVDEDGQKYLVWKSDDNSVGDKTTRIWAQACAINASGITLQGGPTLLAESPGLWWVDSFTPGGALIEGPEIIRRGPYYYLFFASGRFCQSSYSENVARSTKPLGPYEKLGVPLLSTAMVGYRETGEKLEGPGHAAYMKDSDGQWYVVWHAAKEGTCERQAWVDKMDWTEDGWPYVSFTPMSPGFNDQNLETILV